MNFVKVECGVFFAVRTGFLNIIQTRHGFNGLCYEGINCAELRMPNLTASSTGQHCIRIKYSAFLEICSLRDSSSD
jgi:hypothetical protein